MVLLFREIPYPSDEYFKDAMDIYKEAFESTPEIYLDPKVFSESSGKVAKDVIWHLCVLIEENVVAMISFATCIYGGFGGYVAVKGKYRHHGYGTAVLEDMKEVIRKDSDSRGWDINFLFAEYEEKNKGLWESKGFITLPIEYFQPPITKVKKWIPMSLGVVPLSLKNTISGIEIFNFVTFLYSKIYSVKNYSRQQHYQTLRRTCESLNFDLNAPHQSR